MHSNRTILMIMTACAIALALFCAKDINEPLDTLLPFGGIAGSVTDQHDQPLAGVNVTVAGGRGSAVTDANGEFTLANVPTSRTCALLFVRSGYLDTTSDSLSVGNGQTIVLDAPVVMTRATAVIQGTVSIDGTSRPGVGIAVVNQSAATITNASGAFILPDVQPDGKLLIAASGGVGYKEEPISPEPGETLKVTITITSDKNGGFITGIVVDSSGQPRAGVVVSAVGGGILDTTGADGSYKLRNVPTSVPVEVATSTGAKVSGLRVDQGGLLTNIDLTPATATTAGGVTIQNGRYIVPLDSLVTVTAPVTAGSDKAAFYLWNTDNSGGYDTITSTPSLALKGTADALIGFGVVTTTGDTVGGGRITVTHVPTRPRASAGSDTTIKRRQMLTLPGTADCQAGGVKSFGWDFDGNGTTDWIRPDLGTVSHRYNTAGTFRSIFIVTGTSGGSDTDTVIVTVSTDSVIVSDTDLVAPTIAFPPNDTVTTPRFEVMLEPMPPSETISYMLLIGRQAPDSVVPAGHGGYMVFLSDLALGDWYLQPGAARGGDTVWGDVNVVHVQRAKPNLFLVAPVRGDTLGGDSILLGWDCWSDNGDSVPLSFDVRLDENFPPGVTAATGLRFESGVCSLRVAPPSGWSDSTMYYWEVWAIDSADTTKAVDSLFYIESLVTPADSSAGASFAPGPSLKSVHIGSFIARLPDNSIAVMGGHDAGWSALSVAEIWNPAADSFETRPMNFSHDFPAFAAMQNGQYLLAGGAGDAGTAPGYAWAEYFDPITKSFTPYTATLTRPRTASGATTLTNGKVLVVGGWYSDPAGTTGELFDPAGQNFTLTMPLNTARSRPLVLALDNGAALVVGGLPTFGGSAIEAVELFSYDSLSPGYTPLPGNLVPGESGWLPVTMDGYLCDLSEQINADDRYVLLASRGTEYALVGVDRSGAERGLIWLALPLPTQDSVVFYGRPVVDATANKAYLLGHNNDFTTPGFRLYTVDVTNGTVNRPAGWFRPPQPFGIVGMTLMLRGDGKIMACGGSSDGNASTGTANTWVITPSP